MLADAWKQWKRMLPAQQTAVLAAFFAWGLVAFDYFLVFVFVNQIAEDFYKGDRTTYTGFFSWFLHGVFRGLAFAPPVHLQGNAVDLTPILFIAICVTTFMRWIGALVFGAIADRTKSKRRGLIVVVACCAILSFFQAATGAWFSLPGLTSFQWFLVFRALLGVVLGGEWGIGASLVMEWLPEPDMPSAKEAPDTPKRGLFSGIIQQAYPFGNFCAAVVALLMGAIVGGGAKTPLPTWRLMFLVSALLAILLLSLLSICWRIVDYPSEQLVNPTPASPAPPPHQRIWNRLVDARKTPLDVDEEGYRWRNRFWRGAHAVVLVFFFTFMVRGSQDFYPLFLASQVGLANRLTPDNDRLFIVLIYAFSAFLGSLFFGYRSTQWGRTSATQGRLRVIVVAAIFGLVLIPLWSGIFPLGFALLQQPKLNPFGSPPTLFPLPPSPSIVLLIIGAFLMQFVVQGAFGVLPASLAKLTRRQQSERESDKLSATHLGFVYGFGISAGCWIPLVVSALAYHYPAVYAGAAIPNYAVAQAAVLALGFVLVILWVTLVRPWMRTNKPTATEDKRSRVQGQKVSVTVKHQGSGGTSEAG